jgi:hypothetical protein
MSNAVLVIADVTGIQSYVFGSNRLRDHVGASELVACATGTWAAEAFNRLGQTNCTGADHHGRLMIDPDAYLEDGRIVAELLYSGGGNVVALVRSEELARRWAADLTAQVLADAPGLGIVCAHSQGFAWAPDGTDLGARIGELIDRELRLAKQYRTASTPLLGLGVTAECRVTGLPAVAVDETDGDKPISRGVQARLDAIPAAERRFSAMLHDYVGTNRLDFKQPTRLDDLGRSVGDQSYIAVVHADGNGMGKRFKAAWTGRSNRAAITRVRQLSDAVHRAGLVALGQALAPLITPRGGLVAPFDRQEHLPMRPIIYGGDDVTFVCDGRIGVSLAAAFVEALERATATLPDGGPPITSAAGVAIVKTHYPFRRAYDLAEELCKAAKDTIGREVSALDWHIAMSGLLADIVTIRSREYRSVGENGVAHSLTVRPLALRSPTIAWRSWLQMRETIEALQTSDEWAGKRNKVKRLREVLRDGGVRTRQFLSLYGIEQLPGYSAAPRDLRERGWLDGVCGYFDPIELLDFYISL